MINLTNTFLTRIYSTTAIHNHHFIETIMKKNMGGADRVIRILIAVTVGVLYWQGIIQGTLVYVLMALAAIFLITSFISFCPLYKLMGINSCPKK